jgi:hypothetical protein
MIAHIPVLSLPRAALLAVIISIRQKAGWSLPSRFIRVALGGRRFQPGVRIAQDHTDSRSDCVAGLTNSDNSFSETP